jgi:hypothetical protein
MWRIWCVPVRIRGWRLGVSLVVIVVGTRLMDAVLLMCQLIRNIMMDHWCEQR